MREKKKKKKRPDSTAKEVAWKANPNITMSTIKKIAPVITNEQNQEKR